MRRGVSAGADGQISRRRNEVLLSLITGEQTLVARADPRTKARPGRDVQIVADMSRMYAFDRETQQSIFQA